MTDTVTVDRYVLQELLKCARELAEMHDAHKLLADPECHDYAEVRTLDAVLNMEAHLKGLPYVDVRKLHTDCDY